MKCITIILFTLMAICSALPLWISTLSASLEPRQSGLEAQTDRLLFSASMEEFLKARAARNPSTLNWESNGCTASPDHPLGYNFEHSCNRHDFGYRNYRTQNRFTDDAKDRIDLKFKEDMYDECDKKGVLSAAICRNVANVYYEAVSTFGGRTG